MAGLSQINIPSLKKLYSGKVRDTFAVGDDKLLIVSSMDNLMKGAAGTAIHIMNTMFRLVETTGLELKFTSY